MGKNRLTTRSLMACVVLGAFSAVLVHATRLVTLSIQTTLPWLAYPAPVPYFIGIIMAPLLIRRTGVALLTGLIAAIGGFGAMALLAGIAIELVYILGRRALPVTDDGPLLNRRALAWSAIAGIAGGLSLASGVLFFKEVLALPPHLLLTGLAIKVGLGLVYGVISYYLVQALFSIGINPQGLGVQQSGWVTESVSNEAG
ncbi:MAG: hypothetical protein Q4P71_08610 [Actinomycetaceae bacterium]|nr:hypothetical protein [Actinomycetaceae bacterium]